MKLFNWRDKTGSNMSFCLPGLFLGNILTPASRLGGGGANLIKGKILLLYSVWTDNRVA